MQQQSYEFLRLCNTDLAQSTPCVWRWAGVWNSLNGNVGLVAQSANGNTVAAVKYFTAITIQTFSCGQLIWGGGADETNFEHDSFSGPD